MPRPPVAEPVPVARRISALVIACHPEPTALVTVLTSLLALSAGRGWGTVWVTAAVLAGQLSVGWTNDYRDRDLDRAARRMDKPLARTSPSGAYDAALRPTTVRTAAIAALAACVPLSLASGIGFTAAHLTAIAFAMAYTARLKSTLLSVVPYAVAFGLLPAAVALGLPTPRWPPVWSIAAGALIGAGGHFTQALPDIPTDRTLGIHGLPQAVGQPASGALAALLLLAANATVALGPGRPGPLQLAGAALAALLAAGISIAAVMHRPKLAYRLTLAAAAVTVLAFLASGHSLAAGPAIQGLAGPFSR